MYDCISLRLGALLTIKSEIWDFGFEHFQLLSLACDLPWCKPTNYKFLVLILATDYTPPHPPKTQPSTNKTQLLKLTILSHGSKFLTPIIVHVSSPSWLPHELTNLILPVTPARAKHPTLKPHCCLLSIVDNLTSKQRWSTSWLF